MMIHKIIKFTTKHRRFFLADAAQSTGIERRKALRILEKFRKEGYLTKVREERVSLKLNEYGPARRNPEYKVIKDISLRQRKKGLCNRDKIWKTLRFLRKFTRSDLIRLTGCTKTVEDYTRLLALHGYIECIGRSSHEKVWLLVKDSGPKRPHIPEGT
jgi:hypothetical protein